MYMKKVCSFRADFFDILALEGTCGYADKQQAALYVRNIMLQYYLPKWLILALTTVICLEIAKWGRHMVLEQARISGEHSRVETELAMAEQIQRRVLPNENSL